VFTSTGVEAHDFMRSDVARLKPRPDTDHSGYKFNAFDKPQEGYDLDGVTTTRTGVFVNQCSRFLVELALRIKRHLFHSYFHPSAAGRLGISANRLT